MSEIKLRVGDVLLEHGESTLAGVIEDFESIRSRLYGKWTHSMTVCEILGDGTVIVSEALKTGICKTDLNTYIEAGRELLLLRYRDADTSLRAAEYKRLADWHAGRSKYNVWGLLQQAYKLFRLLLTGRYYLNVKNTVKRFMCGSWSCFNTWAIFKDKRFEKYTSMNPVDEATSGAFDISVYKKAS